MCVSPWVYSHGSLPSSLREKLVVRYSNIILGIFKQITIFITKCVPLYPWAHKRNENCLVWRINATRERISLSVVLRVNIHSHTVYYTSGIKKKFRVGKFFLAVFREWSEMWESCLLLMLFFSPTFEFFEAPFPLSSADCHPPWLFLPLPQQNFFVVLSNRIQRPC